MPGIEAMAAESRIGCMGAMLRPGFFEAESLMFSGGAVVAVLGTSVIPLIAGIDDASFRNGMRFSDVARDAGF
ncbi:MAG: hypothetical protein ABJF01_26780, partial [bacterium]